MYFVYILQSLKNNSYYIGSCQNTNKRIKQHNLGKARSTKSNLPWQLVYKEMFQDLSSAIRRELQIKY